MYVHVCAVADKGQKTEDPQELEFQTVMSIELTSELRASTRIVCAKSSLQPLASFRLKQCQQQPSCSFAFKKAVSVKETECVLFAEQTRRETITMIRKYI